MAARTVIRSSASGTGARCERGQVLPLLAFWLVGFMGLAALVIDLGSWYRTHRTMQASADAAALAGAQALPTDAASASVLAAQYTTKNDPALGTPSVTFTSAAAPNDTIKVSVTKSAPGFFSQVFGINSVKLHASASAESYAIGKAKYVAPIAVSKFHPDLANPGCPCFDQPTSIPLSKAGAPGAFDLINLDGSRGGTSPGTLADWMTNGYNGYLGLGDYYSDPGAKFNASAMQAALNARIGTELLFPVYDSLVGTGANAHYNVIGWVGFVMTGFDARGSSGTLYGHFTEVTWDGIEASSGATQPDYGARVVRLIQ